MKHPIAQSHLRKRVAWLPFNDLPLPEAPRLLLLHHAGGAAVSFASWLKLACLKNFAVCPVELPGHGTRLREPLVDDARALTRSLWTALRNILGSRQPIVLLGHSLGALLAYELARRMEEEGRPARAMIASARRAPTMRTPPPWRHRFEDRALIDDLGQLAGTDPRVLADKEMMELFLPVIRNDFALTERYPGGPLPQLSCPLLAVRGEDDPEVRLADLEAWQDVAGHGFAMSTFAGGHFYLNEEPSRTALFDVLIRFACNPQYVEHGGSTQC